MNDDKLLKDVELAIINELVLLAFIEYVLYFFYLNTHLNIFLSLYLLSLPFFSITFANLIITPIFLKKKISIKLPITLSIVCSIYIYSIVIAILSMINLPGSQFEITVPVITVIFFYIIHLFLIATSKTQKASTRSLEQTIINYTAIFIFVSIIIITILNTAIFDIHKQLTTFNIASIISLIIMSILTITIPPKYLLEIKEETMSNAMINFSIFLIILSTLSIIPLMLFFRSYTTIAYYLLPLLLGLSLIKDDFKTSFIISLLLTFLLSIAISTIILLHPNISTHIPGFAIRTLGIIFVTLSILTLSTIIENKKYLPTNANMWILYILTLSTFIEFIFKAKININGLSILIGIISIPVIQHLFGNRKLSLGLFHRFTSHINILLTTTIISFMVIYYPITISQKSFVKLFSNNLVSSLTNTFNDKHMTVIGLNTYISISTKTTSSPLTGISPPSNIIYIPYIEDCEPLIQSSLLHPYQIRTSQNSYFTLYFKDKKQDNTYCALILFYRENIFDIKEANLYKIKLPIPDARPLLYSQKAILFTNKNFDTLYKVDLGHIPKLVSSNVTAIKLDKAHQILLNDENNLLTDQGLFWHSTGIDISCIDFQTPLNELKIDQDDIETLAENIPNPISATDTIYLNEKKILPKKG